MATARYLGVDLAWREDRADLPANETGVAAIDERGQILDAGWRRGVDEALAWADAVSNGEDAVMFVDAPLVVRNETGQRLCETQVGQRYGRWKVSANSTNLGLPRLAGVRFLALAQARGWRYSDGRDGPPATGRVLSESYPYGTLVGAVELGYDTERPRYKRRPRRLPAAQWRRERAANCDTLIGRLGQLETADPPLRLRSHPVARRLADQRSPVDDVAYKHCEDLIDALICAWTAALWARQAWTAARYSAPRAPWTAGQRRRSSFRPAPNSAADGPEGSLTWHHGAARTSARKVRAAWNDRRSAASS